MLMSFSVCLTEKWIIYDASPHVRETENKIFNEARYIIYVVIIFWIGETKYTTSLFVIYGVQTLGIIYAGRMSETNNN